MTVSSAVPLSLYQLLDPVALADPYPLYRRLRSEDPVHWDPYLHAWVLTRYRDVVDVLTNFSARCAPAPEQLARIGMQERVSVARVMARQMLFLDPPQHTRVRHLVASVFTLRRVDALRSSIEEIVNGLIDAALARGELEVTADIANPLPALVTASILGVPAEHHGMLKTWSVEFGQVLGNFQQDAGRALDVTKGLDAMSAYFTAAIRRSAMRQDGGLIAALADADVDGDRLDEDEIVANLILTMVGAQETTANLIATGLLTLLRHPDELRALREEPGLMPSAVEELLRFESPSQYTARIAPADTRLGERDIRAGQGVIALMGAANRDPDRFRHPDVLDLSRADNRHLAFGWGSHFCFGAPLARIEGQIALSTILRRLPFISLAPGTLAWRSNVGLRGLTALPVLTTP